MDSETAAPEPDPTDDLLAPIVAERCRLLVVPPSVLDAVAAHPGVDLEWPGVGLLSGELTTTMPALHRIRQLRDDPDLLAWLVRAIVVPDTSQSTGLAVVGHLGGHDRPDDDGVVEVGYTLATTARGQGLATEAARAWFGWAHDHGARQARLSIQPTNVASQGVARRLGLEAGRGSWDEDDAAWEVVWEATLPLSTI